VRGSFREVKLLKNSVENTVRLAQDVVIPETDDVIPAFFQCRGALSIGSDAFSMLTAINLDDQFPFQRDEIDNISGKQNLPFELDAIELTRSQFRPKQTLGLGGIPAELAGVVSQRLSPLTQPSPQRGDGHFT
jgi:hypothetical protein